MTRATFAAFFLFFPIMITAGYLSLSDEEPQVSAIREAYYHNNNPKDRHLLKQDSINLRKSALKIYPDFWSIVGDISNASSYDIDKFINIYPNEVLTQDLIEAWIKELSKRGTYGAIIEKYYRRLKFPSYGSQCVYWSWKVKSKKSSYWDFISPIQEKMAYGDLDRECYFLVDFLFKSKAISEDYVSKQVHVLFDEGNIDLLREFLFITFDSPLSVYQIKKIRLYPDIFLIRMLSISRSYSRLEKECIIMALSYLSSKKFDQAVHLWYRFMARTTFLPSQKDYLISQYSYQSSRQHRKDAMFWFKKVRVQKGLPHYLQEWLARTALRERNWKQLILVIDDMPKSLSHQDVWVYWKAYALMSLGHKQESEALWKKIAGKYNYYSFLAREALHTKVFLPENKEIVLDEKYYQSLLSNKSIKRAILLHRAGYLNLAIKEWNWITNNLSDSQLLTASYLARDYGMLGLCIQSASMVHYYKGFMLRYPLPYFDTVMSTAKRFHIDPSWVYGVARQESRFMEKAVSAAGAMGIMQVMPHTASVVSRKFHLFEKEHSREIVDPAINIILGSAYLHWIYGAFSKSIILATAAYNAGPNRASLWRDQETLLPATIYIETIPFAETRRYVKNVLANACIYKLILDKKLNHTSHSVKITSFMRDIPSLSTFKPYLSRVP
ncbi:MULTISPECIES: lytic transglycosylase domain-containing protein [Candidatus Ichthyocystis]|uniref:lytic transglycosylase domain-containing protein n=1 Tax=Candidatus Ichthyocystis TaxID=2929841 RepID=UPI0015853A8C|nr:MULTISPECIES: lytic transglycosylase domain-containing protein [Ichthyocystis]